MKERLRSARQAMHKSYPLTEALWEAWLADEAADSPVPDVCELFEAAMHDYLSISLWSMYLS